MQKLISKYATAAHLAILAVAPLLLLPFLSPAKTAAVVAWLALFTFVWVVMEPSRRPGEMLHNSRARVAKAVLTDPLFWFSLVFVAYAGIRALNGGVGMAYDAEAMTWSLRSPTFEMLPGSVSGSGWLPFTVLLSLAIVFQGVRHALGRSARAAFLHVISTLSAVAAIALIVSLSYGRTEVIALARFSFRDSYLHASFLGTGFVITSLIGLVALFSAVERKWMRAEPVALTSLVVNSTAVAVFTPPVTSAVFMSAYLLLAVVSFLSYRHVFAGSASFRCALAILMSVVAPVLYILATSDSAFMVDRVAAFREFKPLPVWYWDVRKVISEASLVTWKGSPWLGTGLDSFPFDLRFALADADWAVVSSMQSTPLCGWWMLLVERGVIGALLIVITFGMLAWTFVVRLVCSFSEVRFAPEHFLGPVVLIVLIALTFFDCSILRPEIMLLAGMAVAFSGGALPVRESEHSDGKDS